MRTQTKDTQANLTPQAALQFLKEGNNRFVQNLHFNRNLLEQVNDTSGGQFPFAIVLSCMDSRTSAELIFDQGLGDIFSVRIAGNVLNNDVLGSMEFACSVAGSKLIVVLGHTKCGAINGACNNVEMGHLTALLEKIKPSIEKVQSGNQFHPGTEEFSEAVATENVLFHLENLLERSSILRNLFKAGKIGLAGGMYSVETGKVEFLKQMFQNTPHLCNAS